MAVTKGPQHNRAKRENEVAAAARMELILEMTIAAIHAGRGPIDRAKTARELKCTVRSVGWAYECLRRDGRLNVEGAAANYRHVVPGVGATEWSLGKPPQPMRPDKAARKSMASPEAAEKPARNPLAMLPIRGSNWTPRTCRYVIGEVKRLAPSSFCEQPVKEGSSYCETHHRLCRIAGSDLKTERDAPPDYRIRRPGERAEPEEVTA